MMTGQTRVVLLFGGSCEEGPNADAVRGVDWQGERGGRGEKEVLCEKGQAIHSAQMRDTNGSNIYIQMAQI